MIEMIRFFDYVNDLVFFICTDKGEMRYRYINLAVKELLKLEDSIIGKRIVDVITDHQEAQTLMDQYNLVYQTKKDYQFRHSLTDGTNTYTGETTMYPIIDEFGNCTFILAIVRNVTEKHILEQQLHETQELFRAITDNSIDIIRMIDRNGNITFSSPSSITITGFSSDYYVGKHFTEVIDDADRLPALQKFEEILLKKNPVSLELQHPHKDGHNVWMEVMATPIIHEGKVTQIVTSSRDITERKVLREKLAQMAFYDYLSGLPNRRLIEDRLEIALYQAKRLQTKVGVILLDGRNFKKINDTHGHDVGDRIIIKVSRKLEECIRKGDTVGRLGGDEFVIILPNLQDSSGVNPVLQRIQEEFQKPVLSRGESYHFQFDLGVAIFPDDGDTSKLLYQIADQKLYAMKKRNVGD